MDFGLTTWHEFNGLFQMIIFRETVDHLASNLVFYFELSCLLVYETLPSSCLKESFRLISVASNDRTS